MENSGERITRLEAQVSALQERSEIEREDRRRITDTLFLKMDQVLIKVDANRENHDANYNRLSKLVYIGVGGIMALELVLKLSGK